MMKSVVVTLALLLALCSVVESKWDDLRVTWGANPFKFFKSQPRTVADAKEAGFKPLDNEVCGGYTAQYNGIAYAKDGDTGLTLLFDKNGYIAGIQIGVTKEQQEDTDFPYAKQRPPFVQATSTTERMVFTAYFVEPSTICTQGRTQQEFDDQGTGTGLWLQDSGNPDEATKMEMEQANVKAPWIEGKCFASMGVHYWRGIKEDLDCHGLYPAFLLYNKGKLNSFGWSLYADLPSQHFEHPNPKVFGLFMKNVPLCLAGAGKISTMHIYFTSIPELNLC